MREILKKHKYLLYTILIVTGLYSIGSVIGMLINIKYTFFQSDCYSQNISYIRLFLDKLFSEGHLSYSFSIGLGAPTIAQFACMGIFNPINIVFVFIRNDSLALVICVLIKLVLAAMSFFYLAKLLHGNTDMLTAVFSSAYALCTYAIAFFYNLAFLDGLYLLPFIVALQLVLIRKKRVLPLALAYAYLFITCFYSGYYIGILSIFSYLIILFCSEEGSSWKNLKDSIFRFIGAGALSLLLSAFVLIPSAIQLFKYNGNELVWDDISCTSIKDFIKAFYSFSFNDIWQLSPSIYIGIALAMGMLIFFISKKVALRKKLGLAAALLILALMSFNKYLYIFIHCFNNPDGVQYRYAFAFSLVMALMGLEVFKDIKAIEKKEMLLATAILLLGVIAFVLDKDIVGIAINVVLILVNLLVLSRNKKRLLYILLVAEILLNFVDISTARKGNIAEQKGVYKTYTQTMKDALQLVNDKTSRISIKNSYTPNETCRYNVRGMELFSTMDNPDISRLLNSLGYSCVERTVLDYGGSEATKLLLGQRYTINLGEQLGFLYDKVNLVEENNCLSIGYCVNDKILELEFTDNAFENTNLLLSSICGEDIRYFEKTNDIEMVMENASATEEDYGVLFTQLDRNSKAYVKFTVASDEDEFCYFSQNASIEIGQSPYLISEGGDSGCMQGVSRLARPHILYMGCDSQGLKNVNIVFDNSTYSEYPAKNCYFYHTNESELNRFYEIMKDKQVVIDSFEDGSIVGSTDFNEDSLVLFTIPYSENWKALCDGIECDVTSVLDNSLCVMKINGGSHDLCLVYKDREFLLGIYLSFFGVLLIILLGVFYENKIKE